MIAFAHTLRARPLVLTRHEVDRLARQSGRDVEPELIALAREAFPARTLGQLLRLLAERLGARP